MLTTSILPNGEVTTSFEGLKNEIISDSNWVVEQGNKTRQGLNSLGFSAESFDIELMFRETVDTPEGKKVINARLKSDVEETINKTKIPQPHFEIVGKVGGRAFLFKQETTDRGEYQVTIGTQEESQPGLVSLIGSINPQLKLSKFIILEGNEILIRKEDGSLEPLNDIDQGELQQQYALIRPVIQQWKNKQQQITQPA